MNRHHVWLALLALLCEVHGVQAEVRLLGVTGSLNAELFPADSLVDLNLSDASPLLLMPLAEVPDSDTIAYNPQDGLVYHASGSASHSDDPLGISFRDSQYFEKVRYELNLIHPIVNANPPESPDEYPAFGFEAPRPTWVAPAEIRLVASPAPQALGPNEYRELRDMAWSPIDQRFYGTDTRGIFALTSTGDSQFVGLPNVPQSDEIHGLTFADVNGTTRLLLGNRSNGQLHVIDPTTAQTIGGPVTLLVPTNGTPFSESNPFGGLLSMDQHPITKVIYGIRRTADPLQAELITLDPLTGTTFAVGNTGAPVTGITFVGFGGGSPGDFDGVGGLDARDIDFLCLEILLNQQRAIFDVNNDSRVDMDDAATWINELANTYPGDANLDGELNSADLIAVFQVGEYEDGIARNSGWADGDWNCDFDFDSGDFIAAFQSGGYEMGPRAAVASVPEPCHVMGLAIGAFGVWATVRRRIVA